jgi:hypothetical protein
MWRVFLKTEMGSAPMIIPAVRREKAPEMRLVDDDHVIETLPPDGADQALDIRVGVSSQLHRLRVVRHKPSGLPIPFIPCGAGRFP